MAVIFGNAAATSARCSVISGHGRQFTTIYHLRHYLADNKAVVGQASQFSWRTSPWALSSLCGGSMKPPSLCTPARHHRIRPNATASATQTDVNGMAEDTQIRRGRRGTTTAKAHTRCYSRERYGTSYLPLGESTPVSPRGELQRLSHPAYVPTQRR